MVESFLFAFVISLLGVAAFLFFWVGADYINWSFLPVFKNQRQMRFIGISCFICSAICISGIYTFIKSFL